jgi:predicted outer membrane repeat protein
VISSNWSVEGAGIWVSGSSPVFADVVVDSNTATHGAGVYCTVNGNASFRSCGILSNTSSGKGGGVYCSSSSPLLENVTFFANSADEGGGGIYSLNSSPILRGALVAFSESGEGLLCSGAPQPLLEYSDVFGNAGGDSLCGLDLGGNISEDPLFCDIWDGDFTLCANSPCLVAGAPSGRIGRHGEGCSNCGGTGLEDGPGQPESWSAPWISAAPSPFSGRTSISYRPPQASDWITLSIYSVSGRKVTTLLDGPAGSASRTIHWDGQDNDGHRVASGVYLCKLNAGGQILERKITLLR